MRLRAPGQHRNDIVRRSAGLPLSLMGLFLAEPPGSHKVCPPPRSVSRTQHVPHGDGVLDDVCYLGIWAAGLDVGTGP